MRRGGQAGTSQDNDAPGSTPTDASKRVSATAGSFPAEPLPDYDTLAGCACARLLLSCSRASGTRPSERARGNRACEGATVPGAGDRSGTADAVRCAKPRWLRKNTFTKGRAALMRRGGPCLSQTGTPLMR